MMLPMLRMEVEHSAGNASVLCEGSLLRGHGVERLSELAGTIIADAIVIDLACIRRVDAHGVGVLVSVAQRLRQRSIPFAVVNAQPQVRAVVEMCGLSSLLGEKIDHRSSAA